MRVRIDVQTFTPGIIFSNAWKNRNTIDFKGQKFHLVSKSDSEEMKKKVSRRERGRRRGELHTCFAIHLFLSNLSYLFSFVPF